MSEQVNQYEIKERIETVLRSIRDSDFSDSALGLLEIIGYKSQRTLPDQTGNVDDFIGMFPAYLHGQVNERNIKSDEALCSNIGRIRFLFQFTDDEIAADTGQINLALSEPNEFDKGWVKSFFFVTAELKRETYPRGMYAQLTREINRRFAQPAVVLFRSASNLLTLAFVHRREHKRNPERDVLGNVSLIREISPVSPHRAHLDILSELSLADCMLWMDGKKKKHDFDGLLAAWLNKLNTDKLNQKFYTELFVWFKRAVNESTFPGPEDNSKKFPSGEEHIIRLITRLLFIWFIKEKGLVADDLFKEQTVSDLLVNFDGNSGDFYYRAILQNLFFATLNTEVDKRSFSKEKNATNQIYSKYRYQQQIQDQETLLALFARTPFINGGLFDCLDNEECRYDIDCFSDNEDIYEKLSIPNRLFFDKMGLFPLLYRYKFTVEENTPIEQEVALDPELLGRVFENLLAAFNPETRDAVRKLTQLDRSNTERNQTGSYYTPRAVVDYMVDEALVASLVANTSPKDNNIEFWQESLLYLLDYGDAFDDASELFEQEEAESIVYAIADIKVLDPAVGSGAYPMGVLQKLALALRRIDPNNKLWQTLQKERAKKKADEAFDIRDRKERDKELDEISENFERYSSDFGRKLYLIQNSIFGVDIQPVACQIAKLRFFISLAIEQDPDNTADNFGIKPLPNLETNFVVADTLLSLKRPEQMTMGQDDIVIAKLEQQLNENRERHFHASAREKKLSCRNQNAALRKELSRQLKKIGFSVDSSEKIAQWDAHDLNGKADWFDPEYMFGVNSGFDIVIGNPPYNRLQKNAGELAKRYKSANFTTFTRTGDIYQLFYERGCELLKLNQGLLSYISSNSWLKSEYGMSQRNYLSKSHTPMLLLDMGKDVFDNAIVETNILLLRQGNNDDEAYSAFPAVDMDNLKNKAFPPEEKLWGDTLPDRKSPWVILSRGEHSILEKVKLKGTPLKDWDISIYRGILTGYNDAFIIDNETKEALIAADPNSIEILKPILRGRHIKRYQAQWAGLWLIDSHNGYLDVPPINIEDYPAVKEHLNKFYPQLKKRQDKGVTPYNLRNCAYHEVFDREKLLWMELTDRGRFAYDDENMYCINTVYTLTGKSLKYLCALLNSSLLTWFMKKTAASSGMGVTRWIEVYVRNIPIPIIPHEEQESIINLFNGALEAKKADSSADISKQEAEIDKKVYTLYDIESKEIEIVEKYI